MISRLKDLEKLKRRLNEQNRIINEKRNAPLNLSKKSADSPEVGEETSYDFLKKEYRFIRDDNKTTDLTWEQEVAKNYYEKLYKEYVLADMSRVREGKLGLRWRVEKEVLSGKGEKICANKKCSNENNLQSFEVPFSYKEDGRTKLTLVKIRVCPECEILLKLTKQYKKVIEGRPTKREEGVKRRKTNNTSV